MKKRIVICADGTWNRPEKDLSNDFPTNVLRLARAVSPVADDGKPQQVFYDWGIGSYYDPVIGGATGRGLNKNIMDDYRYIVQNYAPGDEIFLFGFSRGAYTVRSLCGLIYNCGILKRPDARLIEVAFAHYKNPGKAYAPRGEKSIAFREAHAHPSRQVTFAGVWDTVGALGIPFSFLGLLDKKDEFYDTKIGPNIEIARHALAIDELRSDFEPTVWLPRPGLDLKQVWFAGVHSNIGGSYAPDKETGGLLSDIPLGWMMAEAKQAGLTLEPHLTASLNGRADATLHNSRRHIYRSKSPYYRPIDHGKGPVLLHASVKQRWDNEPQYRPRNLAAYLEMNGDWPALVS
ncbi:MAG: DUF2235 domain-containing protein [Deltaproteobacteria bacterium]|nr:DUF2235 domain-containing protein [Candidatus Anaeroferrophillus wilburensis]MBN2888222.1 DUF2235 domain-containing protein [Deltaproteobacteria bacterium]